MSATRFPRALAGVLAAGRVLNVITDGPDNDIADFYRKLVAGPKRD